MWLKIKTIWLRLFGKEPELTQEEIEHCIVKNVYTLSKMGRVKVFYGSLAALREAQADVRSVVYVIQVNTKANIEKNIPFKQWFNEYLER